jgi:CMP-N,N'-diacetyllegionaminic acid synthase
MRILGLIPARGGSRGVPRKNVRDLCGKPLIAYTIEAARGSTALARVVLSTDDAEIAEAGKRYGAGVPFVRTAELAKDDTPMLPVVRDAVERLEAQGDRYDAICLLQPTNPLRTPEDIDACVSTLRVSGADCVVSVLPVPSEHHPYWAYVADEQGALRLANGDSAPVPRRQALPPAFHREGSVYVVRRDVLMERNTLYGDRVVGHLMESGRSVNIDTPEDWERAEALLRAAGVPA